MDHRRRTHGPRPAARPARERSRRRVPRRRRHEAARRPTSPTPAGGSPRALAEPRRRPGDRVATLRRELARGDAGVVGDRARRRRRRADQHRLQGRVPAPPAGRLGGRRCCSSSRPARAGRAGGRRRRRPSPTSSCSATPRWRRAALGGGRRWPPPARRCARRTSPRSSTPAARPARRRAACSATATTRCSSRQIGICWRRTADDVVWTPLPLFHFNAIVTAVLGPLIYGGRAAIEHRFSVSRFWPEMNRTGATVTSTLGHDGVPARPRRRPPGDAAVGRARGEHVAAADRRRAAAGRGRLDPARSASASTPSAAPTARPRRRWCRGSRWACRTSPTPPA